MSETMQGKGYNHPRYTPVRIAAMFKKWNEVQKDEDQLAFEPSQEGSSLEGHNPPTLRLLHDIIQKDGTKFYTRWYDLGLQLLEKHNGARRILDEIYFNNPNDASRCLRMFDKWLEQQPLPSWNQLLTALNNLNLNTTVKLIRDQLGFEPSQEGSSLEAVCTVDSSTGTGMDERSALESQLEKLNAEIVELKEEKILYENKLQRLDADLEQKKFQLKVESDKNVELQKENQRLIEDQKEERNAHLTKLQKINAEWFKERSQNDTKIKKLNEDYQTLSKKQKAESEGASTHEPENYATI